MGQTDGDLPSQPQYTQKQPSFADELYEQKKDYSGSEDDETDIGPPGVTKGSADYGATQGGIMTTKVSSTKTGIALPSQPMLDQKQRSYAESLYVKEDHIGPHAVTKGGTNGGITQGNADHSTTKGLNDGNTDI